ncbi:MAG: hypothetical protein ACKVP7_01450 [Hyphomicrobiaceae bacterium]
MDGLGLADSSDESLRALNFILEAWEEASDSGIRPQLVAYAAIYTALSDLVGTYGEDAVAKLVQGLGARVSAGEFTLPKASLHQ